MFYMIYKLIYKYNKTASILTNIDAVIITNYDTQSVFHQIYKYGKQLGSLQMTYS